MLDVELMGGGARILSQAHRPKHLERKAAALVTYLALEGPTYRGKLAGLLWPDVPERSARSNLRQLLRRLRVHLRLQGDDPVWLWEGLLIDAVIIREVFASGDYGRLSGFGGQLLAGLTYGERLVRGASFTSGLSRWFVMETLQADMRDEIVRNILHLLRQDP